MAKHVKSSARPSIPDAPLRATTRGNQTPSLPTIVAVTFSRLNLRMRARMLGRLLASVGPLALTVIGGGAFAKYVTHARLQEIPVSIDDAARATSSQIYEIVRYVEQSNPHLVDWLLAALLQDGMTMTALGASVAAIAIRRLSGRRGWRPQSFIRK